MQIQFHYHNEKLNKLHQTVLTLQKYISKLNSLKCIMKETILNAVMNNR